MCFIYICGLPGSGKGTIRVLLDGSNKLLLNCPFQGFGYEILEKSFDDFLNRKKPIDLINRQKKLKKGFIFINNKILTLGEFYQIVSRSFRDLLDASNGKYIRAASNQNSEQFVNFSFSFKSFIKKIEEPFYNNLNFKNKFFFYEYFFICFYLIWKNINLNKSNYLIVVSMHNGANVLLTIDKNVPKNRYKIISMSRNIEGLILTNYLRYSRKLKISNLFFKIRFFFSFNTYFKYFKYLKVEKSIEENLLTINFENLILKNKISMKTISNFLKISFCDDMLIPTLDSNILVNDFTDKVIDEPRKKLNKIIYMLIKFYTLVIYLIFRIKN